MYDFIIVNPKKALRTQKRELSSEKTCKLSSQIFSVPSGSKKISKNDGHIIIEEILTIAKPLDALRFVYKNRFILFSLYKEFCENNIDYMIVRDVIFFVFFIALIIIFVIYCLKKFITAKESEKNLLPVTWTDINTLMQEERELTNKKINEMFVKNLQKINNGQPVLKTNTSVSKPKSSKMLETIPETNEADTKSIASEKPKPVLNTNVTNSKTKASEKPTDGNEIEIFELKKIVTLEKMNKNPSQIDFNIKKEFARLVIGINVRSSGESLINKKIVDYLEVNKK